jgi:hypothetical protein
LGGSAKKNKNKLKKKELAGFSFVSISAHGLREAQRGG